MPRQPRVVLPGYPHHIVQRGHNRHAVFAQARDYCYYMDSLRTWKAHYGVRLYAYCLMTNHVHLILEPAHAADLGRLMKRVAARQTRLTNALASRSGTLWEGRYKSSPIETDSYLLACCRYIELNPVRARMVSAAEDYPWSSHAERINPAVRASLLDDHPTFIALGESPDARASAYRDFVASAIPKAELKLIRQAVQRGQLTGGRRFVTEVEAIVGRRIEHRGPGRAVGAGKWTGK